jgi:hypothetical protein
VTLAPRVNVTLNVTLSGRSRRADQGERCRAIQQKMTTNWRRLTFDLGLGALYPRSESASSWAAMRCVVIQESGVDV